MANTPHPSPHKVVANGSHLPQLPRRTDHAYTTLADRLGVPRGTLKDWMRGKYPIAYEFRPAIISFLREQMAATRQLIDYVQNAPLPAPKIRGVAAKAQQV